MTQEDLHGVIRQLLYYRQIGEKAMAQLPDEALFYVHHQDTNSVATLVQHLSGNMRSRWTNFLGSDGEKPWRDRDAEFEIQLTSRAALDQQWAAGWDCLFEALQDIGPDQLEQIIYIRHQGHTVSEAILRQLAHYAYHVGQIVFLAKWLTPHDWQSLSIPRGQSKAYNADKFGQGRRREHFTDEGHRP